MNEPPPPHISTPVITLFSRNPDIYSYTSAYVFGKSLWVSVKSCGFGFGFPPFMYQLTVALCSTNILVEKKASERPNKHYMIKITYMSV